MTYRYEKLGDTEDKTPPIKRFDPYIEDPRIYHCDVCKCRCTINLTVFGEKMAPRYCPFENDLTNLRYAKWERVA